MRIAIDHRTRYRFTKPQARIVQLLRMTPQDGVDQTVVHWHIGVDCDARLRETRDGFGNKVTMLYASGPIEHIELSVTGEVLTADGNGIVGGAWEPLPPLLFTRASARAGPTREIAEFAAGFEGGDAVERLHRLNFALFSRYEPSSEDHDAGRSAGETFAQETATPRDLAHVFIAAARSLAVPARYITGYRADGVDHRPAPCAWAEAHVEGLGWVTFDPSRGVSADERYVRVSVGLDAATAAPVAGSRLGEGREELDVDVHVETLSGAG
jgi:transglutaminase-like putative cysteine protease